MVFTRPDGVSIVLLIHFKFYEFQLSWLIYKILMFHVAKCYINDLFLYLLLGFLKTPVPLNGHRKLGDVKRFVFVMNCFFQRLNIVGAHCFLHYVVPSLWNKCELLHISEPLSSQKLIPKLSQNDKPTFCYPNQTYFVDTM